MVFVPKILCAKVRGTSRLFVTMLVAGHQFDTQLGMAADYCRFTRAADSFTGYLRPIFIGIVQPSKRDTLVG